MFQQIVKNLGSFFSGLLGGGAKKAPKAPAPAPKPKKPLGVGTVLLPKNHPQQKSAKTQAGIFTDAFKRPLQSRPLANSAAAQAARNAEAERVRKENIRRGLQTKLDSSRLGFSTVLSKSAQNAVRQKSQGSSTKNVDWRQFFEASGRLKGGGEFREGSNVYSPAVQAARKNWLAWSASSRDNPIDGGDSDDDLKVLFERTKDEYKRKAQNISGSVEKQKQPFSWFFGGTRAQIASRDMAKKRHAELQRSVDEYNAKANNFVKVAGQKNQRILQLKARGSQRELDAAVADYNNWARSARRDLTFQQAAIEGLEEGYRLKADSPISTAPAKFLQAGGELLGKVWKYTLGEGDEKIPSLVTAPNRLITTVGNIVEPNRQINMKDGTSTNRLQTKKDAWTASFNQRNLNIANYKVKPFDRAAAERMWGENLKREIEQHNKTGYGKKRNYDVELRNMWVNTQQMARAGSNIGEFFADPLSLVPPAKVAKSLGWGRSSVSGIAKFTGLQKVASWAGGTRAGQLIKKAWSEYKPPEQIYSEKVQQGEVLRRAAQEKLGGRLIKLRSKLEQGKINYAIFDEIRDLSPDDAAILQRSFDGKLAARDRLSLWTRLGRNPRRKKLEDLSRRWTDFTEQMRAADKISDGATSFGRGKRIYFARSPIGKNIDDVWFRRQKKSRRLQSPDQLHESQVDRLFASNFGVTGSKKQERVRAEINAIQSQYNDMMAAISDDVGAAYAKTRTPWNRAKRAISAPMRFWKKAVLSYNPAWYVNNVAYNVPASVIAGGLGALPETLKLLRPGALRKARAEAPFVSSSIGKETGRGFTRKLATNVEDLSRYAAFHALRNKKVMSGDALKQVNDFLFDYKLRNFERPIRSVLPFYLFSKGLGKAAVKMPLTRPYAAKAFNEIERQQQRNLQELPEDQRKYYKGKIKIGDRWVNAPFLAFSEKGMSGAGVNPFISAGSEVIANSDYYGEPLKKMSYWQQLLQKFPQFNLGRQAWDASGVQWRGDRPKQKWIGSRSPGGDFGMTKESQGYDPSKSNYVSKLDPRASLGQKALAFLGVPKTMTFDRDLYNKRDKLKKFSDEFFKIDWQKSYPDFTARTNAQNALAKQWNIDIEKDFYKGELTKYDSDDTRRIKKLKDEARAFKSDYFARYGAVPKGKRGQFALAELEKLVKSGKVVDNPYIAEDMFKWVNPESRAKVAKSAFWQHYFSLDKAGRAALMAKHPEYQKYTKRGMSDKAAFWKKFYATSDKNARRQLLQANPKYARRGVKSDTEIAEAVFWKKYYAEPDKLKRRALLDQNPTFRRFALPKTTEEWDAAKTMIRTGRMDRAMKNSAFVKAFASAKAANVEQARKFLSTKRPKFKKITIASRNG